MIWNSIAPPRASLATPLFLYSIPLLIIDSNQLRVSKLVDFTYLKEIWQFSKGGRAAYEGCIIDAPLLLVSGNDVVVTTLVAEQSTLEERTKAMVYLSVAQSLGFTLGPGKETKLGRFDSCFMLTSHFFLHGRLWLLSSKQSEKHRVLLNGGRVQTSNLQSRRHSVFLCK